MKHQVAWERVLNGELHTSAYCVRKGLTRKANMAYNLKKWVRKPAEHITLASCPTDGRPPAVLPCVYCHARTCTDICCSGIFTGMREVLVQPFASTLRV